MFRTNKSKEQGNPIKKSGFHLPFSGVLPLFVVAHFSHHLVNALPVPLLPMIRSDFALSYTQAGFIISAFSLSYGIAQLPAGWLADRIGARTLITISICGVALTGILVGLSQTYIMLIAFLILMGILGGGYHPASPPIVAASVESKNRGRALGFHMIGGSASFFLTPLIAAATATAWGWRGSFSTLAIPAMVYGIVFYVLLGRWAGTKKTKHTVITDHKETPPAPRRLHHLVPFIVLSAFSGAVTMSVISFIPLFAVDRFGASAGVAAALVAVIYSAGLWVSPLGGYLSDRLGTVPVTLAVCFITGPVIYLLNLVSYGLSFGALLLIIGIVMYIRMPAAEAHIISQTSERHRSTVLGIYYFGGMEGAGVVTPIVGRLIDQFGFYSTFTIAGIALVVVTLLCAIFLRGKPD